MTHISTRKPGTLCYTCGNHEHYARVEAIVVSSNVFIAQLIAESQDGMVYVDVDGERDIMRPVSDLKWYDSEITGEPTLDAIEGAVE